MAFGGVEAASLHAVVGVDIGSAVNNLARVGSEFDQVARKASSAQRATGDFGSEAREWANDFGRVAEEAATASVAIDRLARRREMPLDQADQLRARLDQIGQEADNAGAQLAELARAGKAIDPTESARLAQEMQRLEHETREAVGQVKQLDHATDAAAASSNRFRGVLSALAVTAGALGFAGLAYTLVGLVRGMVQGAAQVETSIIQFKTLLGSIGAARQRLGELVAFARATPFALPQIIEASRMLEVLTRGAISTGAGLKLVGDIAAGTDQRIEEVAIWVGRLYDALQSGRPFGEAALRLQEMGALSGEGRDRLEKLAEAVKSGSMTMAEAWAAAGEEFTRFDGLMEEMSESLGGQWSNLMDALGVGLANLGEKLMPLAKQVVPAMITGMTNLLEAAAPVVTVVGSGLTIVFERLTEIALLASVAIGVKFVRAVEGATIAMKLATIAGKAMTGVFLAIPLFVRDAEKGLQGIAGGMDATSDSAVNMNAAMSAGFNVFQAQKLVSMGISMKRMAQAVEAAGGDVQKAFDMMKAGQDPVAKAWASWPSEATRAAAIMADRLRVQRLAMEETGRTSVTVAREVFASMNFEEMTDLFQKQFGDLIESVRQVPGGLSIALSDGSTVFGDAAQLFARILPNKMDEARLKAIMDMRTFGSTLGAELFDTVDDFESYVQQFIDRSMAPFTSMQRMQAIQEALSLSNIRSDIFSGDPVLVNDAIEFVDRLVAEFLTLAPEVGLSAEEAMVALRSGFGAENIDLVLRAAENVRNRTGAEFDIADILKEHGLEGLMAYIEGIEATAASERHRISDEARLAALEMRLANPDWYQSGFTAGDEAKRGITDGLPTGTEAQGWGFEIGRSFAAGLSSAYSYVFDAAQQLRLAARHHLRFEQSPPYTESRNIGAMVGQTWGEGLANALRALAMPDLSGLLGGPSLGQAALAPAGFAALPAAVPGPGTAGDTHYHFELTVEGDLRVEDEDDVAQAMQRLASVSTNLVAR